MRRFRAQVTAQPDAKIAELRGWVLREHGISISMASMWTTLVRLSLTLKKSSPRGRAAINPAGCWNWFGYGYDDRYPLKAGVQVTAIYNMIRRVMGQTE